MKRWLAALSALLAACASQPVAGPGYVVDSNALGLRMTLEDWVVFREAESSPAMLAPVLGSKQDVDDSPLLIAIAGTNPNASLIAAWEPATVDVETFARQALERLASDGEVYEARKTPDGRGVRIAYRTRRGVLTLRAWMLVFVHAGRAYTLLVSSPLEGDLSTLLADAASGLELRTASRAASQAAPEAGVGWERPFAALPRELAAPDLMAVSQISPDDEASPFDSVECPPGARQLLYRATSGNGVAHLFGSIHLGRDSFYPFDGPIEQAFAASSRLGVELDIRNAGSPEAQQAFAEIAAIDGDASLRDALSDDAYGRLADTLDDLGLSIELFEELQPWAVAMTISTLVWQAQGFDAAKGVDLYFLERAGGREIVELESLQEQLDLFASLDGEHLLEMTLDSIDTVEQDTADLHRAWLCGDAELLSEVAIERPRERDPEIETFVTEFLDRRNEGMAEDIVTLLERGGESFVVIGAAHLVGPHGVPELLRQRGVRVEAR